MRSPSRRTPLFWEEGKKLTEALLILEVYGVQ